MYRTIAVAHACNIAIVHACTIAIVHACTIVIVHVCIIVIKRITRGSGGRSPPVSQGVQRARPSGFAVAPVGAAASFCRGSGGAAPSVKQGGGWAQGSPITSVLTT